MTAPESPPTPVCAKDIAPKFAGQFVHPAFYAGWPSGIGAAQGAKRIFAARGA